MAAKLARKAGTVGNRKPAILRAAAKLFVEHGFVGSSMRMIADLSKVQAASLYYHFPSKADILVSVYQESGRRMTERVQTAIAGATDPWERLELACCAHISAVLSDFDFIHVLFTESPRSHRPDIRKKLITARDAYEGIFRELINALPLRRDANRKYVLLALLGAIAWSRVWYVPEGDSPETIARNILKIIRSGVERSKGPNQHPALKGSPLLNQSH